MDIATTLLELQERDTAVVRLRKQLDDMPERTRILQGRRKIADIGRLRERAASIAEGFAREIARLEDDVALVTEKLESEQAKMMSGTITDPRELTNISREMDALRRARDKAEFTMLEQLEKRETAQAQVDKVDAAIAEHKEADRQLVAAYQTTGGHIKTELETAMSDRAKVAKKLPADMLARYEQLRESKMGVAVGRLVDGSCSSCRRELPAERMSELKGGPAIAECPMCHRMLIIGQ